VIPDNGDGATEAPPGTGEAATDGELNGVGMAVAPLPTEGVSDMDVPPEDSGVGTEVVPPGVLLPGTSGVGLNVTPPGTATGVLPPETGIGLVVAPPDAGTVVVPPETKGVGDTVVPPGAGAVVLAPPATGDLVFPPPPPATHAVQHEHVTVQSATSVVRLPAGSVTMAQTSAGIEPLIAAFPLKFTSSNSFSVPSSVGICPLRPFLLTSRFSSETSMPISEEIVPVRKFADKYRASNAASEKTVLGMGPLMALVDSCSSFSSGKRDKSGIVPSRLELLKPRLSVVARDALCEYLIALVSYIGTENFCSLPRLTKFVYDVGIGPLLKVVMLFSLSSRI
jgi:hypothetical protein